MGAGGGEGRVILPEDATHGRLNDASWVSTGHRSPRVEDECWGVL